VGSKKVDLIDAVKCGGYSRLGRRGGCERRDDKRD
jgi:hypothetical protein